MSQSISHIVPEIAQPQLRRSVMPWLALARGGVAIGLLLMWEAFARWVPDLIAGPLPTLLRVIDLVRTGEIVSMVWATTLEAIGGLLIGAGLGVVLPFVVQMSPRLSAVIEPFAKTTVGIPKLALSPILIMWFGIGLTSKIVLVALMTFFLVFVATFVGIRSVGPNLIRTVAIFGAGKREIAREVLWNSSQPFVWAALRAALPWAINAALVGEFLAAENGIGYYIHHSYNVADITGVYAGMVITAALVLLADAVLRLFQRRALAWRPDNADQTLH
ncbi:ABC transporter permease [Tardiphaga sp. 37S4]|jgi:NitT/TauT family transport system permease protein|uniref:ABC transporter permease n=1 Tax=Tardiphaga sp. 37S4 TaxID=1404741 RepID=UPI001E53422C|nr:ABC transporter permease [Tardiphaga sp. 37S4]UFS76309.1 ABC transporter permease [Tardiphaga sp. 37S4]